jgi:hypothetical protein
MAHPANNCFECPDATKHKRGCLKPLRVPERYKGREWPAPSCPVLDVPSWWYDMVDAGHKIESGAIRAGEVSGRTYAMATAAYASLHSEREGRRKAEEKALAARQAAARSARGQS